MSTSQLPDIHVVPTAAVPGVTWRIVTAIVTGALAASAYYGSWYLTEEVATRQLPVGPPQFLPGSGWGFGALALLILVAAPMTVACLTAIAGHSAAAVAAMVAGALLMGWIVVQVLLIGVVFWLQPAMLVAGAVVLALGMWAYHPQAVRSTGP